MASSSSIKAGEGHVVLGINMTELEKGLKEAEQNLRAFGKGIQSIGLAIAAVGGAITAPFLASGAAFADLTKELHTAARTTGMSFSEVQSSMAGTRQSAEELQSSTAKMNSFFESAANGSAEAIEALNKMGLTIESLAGMSQSQRLRAVADGLQRITDAGQRGALQRQILGRGATNVNLTGGSAGMDERAAREFYLAPKLSDQDIAMGKEMHETYREMGLAVGSVWKEVGAIAAPIMTAWAKSVTDIVVKVRQWIQENRPLMTQIFIFGGALVGIGTVVAGIGTAFIGLGAAIAGVVAAVSAVASLLAFAVSPAGLILGAAALSALALALALYEAYQRIEGFRNYMNEWGPILERFGATAKQVFGGIGDALSAGEFQIAWDITCVGMELVWTRMINFMADGWRSFKYLFVNVITEMAEVSFNVVTGIARVFLGTIASMLDGMISMVNRAINSIPEFLRNRVGIEAVDFTAQGTLDAAVRNMRAQIRSPATAMGVQTSNEREQARQEEAGIQARLDDLTGQAESARIIADHMAWLRSDAEGETGSWQMKALGGYSSGTFSADAIAGFIGGGESPQEEANRLLNVQNQQNEEIIRILTNIMAEGGLGVI